MATLRTAVAQRGPSALEALLAHAHPHGATEDALAERPRWLPRIEGRKALALLGCSAVAAIAFVLTRGPGAELAAAFERAAGADWRWAALGVVFEALAFAGLRDALLARRGPRGAGPRPARQHRDQPRRRRGDARSCRPPASAASR